MTPQLTATDLDNIRVWSRHANPIQTLEEVKALHSWIASTLRDSHALQLAVEGKVGLHIESGEIVVTFFATQKLLTQ